MELDNDPKAVATICQVFLHHFFQQNTLGVLASGIISEDHGRPLCEAQQNNDHMLYWLAKHNAVSFWLILHVIYARH